MQEIRVYKNSKLCCRHKELDSPRNGKVEHAAQRQMFWHCGGGDFVWIYNDRERKEESNALGNDGGVMKPCGRHENSNDQCRKV